ncbi:hypothetical protein EDC01DRAFT_626463 [Geopyxis carbonaria]|nr:hypothetical protein EDC01DRAFT_626463 [Geopyxis carbonaria]
MYGCNGCDALANVPTHPVLNVRFCGAAVAAPLFWLIGKLGRARARRVWETLTLSVCAGSPLTWRAYKGRHRLDLIDYVTANTHLLPDPFYRPVHSCRPCKGYSWRRSDRLRPPLFSTRAFDKIIVACPEVVLGQTVLIRVSLKLLSYSVYCDDIGKETKRLFGKIDGKVWKLIANPKEPHIYVDPNDQHSRLSLRYTDGFPDDWKTSDDTARFWYHIVYEYTPGSKLSVHLSDLPDDHPKSELEAFAYVGRLSKELPPNSSQESLAARSLLSSFLSPVPAQLPTVRSTVPSSVADNLEFKDIMNTKFPARIRGDRLVGFDGKPQRIFTLDLSVEDMCGEHNYPRYYGGTVVGNAEDGYQYVEYDTPGGAPNYQFGSRVCSAITSRFVDDAAVWWEDYRQAGGSKPNCWKTSAGCGVDRTRPPDVVEISLFDIVTRDFPAENDVTEAKLELSRLKWNAGASDVMPFATFRNKSTALAKRAGYIGWDQQCPVIRKCIEPYSLRKAVQIYDTADTFWFHTRANVNTWLREHENVQIPKKCLTCGGNHESSSCRKPNSSGYPRLTSNAPKSAACDWCSIKGHYKSECLRLKNQISRGEVPADERTKQGGPPKAPAPLPQAPPPQSRVPARTGLPRPANSGGSRPFTCRNCGGAGHAAAVCPSAKKAAVAATNLVDDNVHDSDEDDIAQYIMNAWTPRGIRLKTGQSGHRQDVAAAVCQYEGIDELFSTVVANTSIDFPLFNNISTPVDKIEVIDDVVGKTSKTSAVVKVSDAIDMSALGPPAGDVPSGPVWTTASTLRGQDLLTIFDTGAVKAAIPLSTANGSPLLCQSGWNSISAYWFLSKL